MINHFVIELKPYGLAYIMIKSSSTYKVKLLDGYEETMSALFNNRFPKYD